MYKYHAMLWIEQLRMIITKYKNRIKYNKRLFTFTVIFILSCRMSNGDLMCAWLNQCGNFWTNIRSSTLIENITCFFYFKPSVSLWSNKTLTTYQQSNNFISQHLTCPQTLNNVTTEMRNRKWSLGLVLQYRFVDF